MGPLLLTSLKDKRHGSQHFLAKSLLSRDLGIALRSTTKRDETRQLADAPRTL